MIKHILLNILYSLLPLYFITNIINIQYSIIKVLLLPYIAHTVTTAVVNGTISIAKTTTIENYNSNSR